MSVTSDILETLEPITLDEMDSIRLMNRIDTKFLTTLDGLDEFMRRAKGRYMAFELGSGRLLPYDTVYYDTPELRMYLDHHNRRLVRRKVRVRTYMESGTTYLEVKMKNNHGRTKKKRIEFNREGSFTPEQAEWLESKSGFAPSDISPKLRTVFNRITLVNMEKTERLTIDLDLRFENLVNGNTTSLGPAVIIELKQDGAAPSPAKKILSDLRIHPFKISKYCIGTATTTPDLKQNRFKGKIRKIEKLTDNKIALI